MEYKLKELEEKLGEKISELGIDIKLNENPAYELILKYELGRFRNEVYYQRDIIDNEFNKILVKQDEKSISFNFRYDRDSKERSLSIFVLNPNEFSIVEKNETDAFIDGWHPTLEGKRKVYTQKIVRLHPNQFIETIETIVAIEDEEDEIIGEENRVNITHCSALKEVYDSNGIMIEQDKKISTKRYKIQANYDKIATETALYLSNNFFDSQYENHIYDIRIRLIREKLDVAKITHERENQMKYSSYVKLERNEGLQVMDCSIPRSKDSRQVYIGPLSAVEVEEMLSFEKNPKVKEGLKAYAIDRDKYIYDSSEDPDFICVVDKEQKVR